MEQMVNRSLVWFIESNNLFINFQCGFRSRRSTMDHVVRLKTSIRKANVQKQLAVATFLNQEKAYETTWWYGIMNDRYNMGLKNRLPNFMKAFLSGRKFRVRIVSTLLNIHNQKDGVLQGSILLVTLFNIIASPIAWILEMISICLLMTSASSLHPNIYVQKDVNFSRASTK